jgi:hypothetical protein
LAEIKAEWSKVRIPAAAMSSWKETKACFDKKDVRIGGKFVYIIRTCKPYAIAYEAKASPVLYIGEGVFEDRLKSHLKRWIQPFTRDLVNLEIEVFYTEIKVRNNNLGHRDVEADLLSLFSQKYKSVPLMNKQFEYHNRKHIYKDGFFRPLQSDRGAGYLWAIRPLKSNMAYAASLKGLLR